MSAPFMFVKKRRIFMLVDHLLDQFPGREKRRPVSIGSLKHEIFKNTLSYSYFQESFFSKRIFYIKNLK